MTAPEISVVLAVRNEVERLESCLDSVLSQEGILLELIVVDDGSTDGSAQLLANRARHDGRLQLVPTGGVGLTSALRAGCAAARAPWIARQDGRDVSLPGRFRRQLEVARGRSRLVLISCYTECLAPGGELLYVERGRAEPDIERDLFDRAEPDAPHVGPTSHGSAVFKREAYERVGGYRSAFPLGQDWDLWLRLGEIGTFLTVGETLYRRTLFPGSASFRRRKLQLAFGVVSTEASRLRRLGESEEPALLRARLLAERWRHAEDRGVGRSDARAFYHFGETLRRRRHPAGRRYLLRAVQQNPLLLRAWIRLLQSLLDGSHGPDAGPETVR